MSKTGYRSVSLPDDLINELIEIGVVELEPKGVEPKVPTVIKMLVKQRKDQNYGNI